VHTVYTVAELRKWLEQFEDEAVVTCGRYSGIQAQELPELRWVHTCSRFGEYDRCYLGSENGCSLCGTGITRLQVLYFEGN
jgi:hypothetical protein